MSPPQNILDHLADSAKAQGTEFPGTIYKRWRDGAHGRSVTQDLLIFAEDGQTYRVSLERIADDDVSEFVKDAHKI